MATGRNGGREQHDHIHDYENVLIATALKILEREKPDIWPHLQAIHEIEESSNAGEITAASKRTAKKARTKRYKEVITTLKKGDPKIFLEVMTAYGNVNDLRRSARKIASLDVMEANHALKDHGINADKIEFTLHKFAQESNGGVRKEVVQRYIDELSSSFSITPHPTNGTSVEHSRLGIEVENLLADKTSSKEELEAALTAFLTSDIVGPKKTVAQEVEEGIAVLDNLYDANIAFRNSVRKALDNNGYQDVKIRTPLLKPSGWFSSDGDGNPNATEQALREGIDALKERVKERYAEDLRKIANLPGLKEKVGEIKTKLESGEYQSSDDFKLDIESLKTGTEADASIDDLLFQIETFGLHYAKLDVRHDAKSLRTTIGNLLEKAGIIKAEDFHKLDEEEKAEKITGWLSNEEVLDKLKAIDHTSLEEVSGRVFGRLRVIAGNPDMSEKLIIAEAETASDALTAMLLLKASGNEVANDKTKMNIVTLSESLEDLESLPDVIRTLTSNETYRAHLDAMGGMIVMVAESDNRRKGGFSAGHKINDTIGKLIKLSKDLDIPISVFNGGGASQMRGAQKRPTEIGFQHGYLAKRADSNVLYQPYFTVQGHQARLLFSPTPLAAHMIEGTLSQIIWSKAGVERQISNPTLSPEGDRAQYPAREDADLLHKAAIESFNRMKLIPSIDTLLENAPWVSVTLGNASSRPSKRGGTDKGANSSPAQIKGDSPKALEQRAITGDNIGRSFGVPPLPILGQQEGFEEMFENGMADHLRLDRHTNTYENSKPERDHMRSLAISLFMADFDKAWHIILDRRPSPQEVKTMASEFDPGSKDNKDEVTLAFLEQYALDTAQLLYQAIPMEKRREFAEGEFTLKTVLTEKWPELAEQMLMRNRRLEFANAVEAELTRDFNQQPDMVIDEGLARIVQATQASVALNNTPAGMLATATSKDKGAGLSGSHKRSIPELHPKLPEHLAALATSHGVSTSTGHSR